MHVEKFHSFFRFIILQQFIIIMRIIGTRLVSLQYYVLHETEFFSQIFRIQILDFS